MTGEVLGIAAAAAHLLGYGIYVRQIWRTEARPNTASWFIWAYGSGLEAWSYFAMSRDWIKSLLPVTCSLACVATFLVILGRGKVRPISAWEWVCVIFDVVAVLIWWRWQSATLAQLVMQAAVPVSFAPILLSVARNPESPLPWAIWSIAYVLGLGAVILRWDQWPDAVYCANYLVWTVAVWIACGWKRKNLGSHGSSPSRQGAG